MDIINKNWKAGVLNGSEALQIFEFAKEKGFAIPAVNVLGTNSINAALEAAAKVKSPIIIQFAHARSSFFIGASLDNTNEKAAVAGAIAGAHYVHAVAKLYNIPVILHTDHCNKKHLLWLDELIKAGEQHYNLTGLPLFTSHMLDFSEQPIQENIETSVAYLKRLAAINMMLEIELGITGGEEGDVDNTSVDSSLLYTQPAEVMYAYDSLKAVSDLFSIAASFGNVHGVYQPGKVKLEPKILLRAQQLIQQTHQTAKNPVNFVFHGGSGSSAEEIKEAISYGVVKMNIDTDIQWAFWEGVSEYAKQNKLYLKAPLGNPKGENLPNKAYYDPQTWLRKGELATVEKLISTFESLKFN